MNVKKYDIVLVHLDPTQGSEQKGTRPCLVVQNNQANDSSMTVVVCPFTTRIKEYYFFLKVLPSEENGLCEESCADFLQIRTVDKHRIIRKMGRLELFYRDLVSKTFFESFDLQDWF